MTMTPQAHSEPKLGQAPHLLPALMTIPTAVSFSGKSRAGLYRGLARRDFAAVKDRGRTLIVTESLLAHLASLPAATFRVAKAA